MNGDDAGQIIYLVLALGLVGSYFVSRRMPLGQTLKMALAWVAIFGAVALIFLAFPGLADMLK